jgi:hypothetical protein
MALDPERAMGQAIVSAVADELDSPEARLGTEAHPQLEMRVGVDLPFWLLLSNSPHLKRSGTRLQPITLEDAGALQHLRIMSDDPARAAALLTDADRAAALAAIVGCNAPWATQLTLRPAASGRGAGAYLLSVAAGDTTAERLADAIRLLLELSAGLPPPGTPRDGPA